MASGFFPLAIESPLITLGKSEPLKCKMYSFNIGASSGVVKRIDGLQGVHKRMCNFEIVKFTRELWFSLHLDDGVNCCPGAQTALCNPKVKFPHANVHRAPHLFLTSLPLLYSVGVFFSSLVSINNTTCCDDLCKQQLCYIRSQGPIIASLSLPVSRGPHRNTGAVLPHPIK